MVDWSASVFDGFGDHVPPKERDEESTAPEGMVQVLDDRGNLWEFAAEDVVISVRFAKRYGGTIPHKFSGRA